MEVRQPSIGISFGPQDGIQTNKPSSNQASSYRVGAGALADMPVGSRDGEMECRSGGPVG
nr:hypothetical protein [Bacteroidota bacterium]